MKQTKFLKQLFFACMIVTVTNFFALKSVAQTKLNFGLSQPQDKNTLPKSKASFQKPEVNISCLLQKVADSEYIIESGWELADADKVRSSSEYLFSSDYNTSKWYNATVPGTVLTTLVQQGVYPDPYFGLNNLAIPDTLCRKDWWYRVSFRLPEKETNNNVWLILNGINYQAEVWLNGEKLGNINGAFIRGKFNVTDVVHKTKSNVLAIRILPPNNPGIPHEESPSAGTGPNGGQLCMDGPTFISSEGWDWMPGIRDRNIGIWQDVRIKYTGNVTLGDPQVITDLPLPDTTSADVFIRSDLTNHSGKPQSVTLHCELDGFSLIRNVDLKPFEQKAIEFSPKQYRQLKMKNPKLWWPNGYGDQNLYRLDLSVEDGEGKESDRKSLRFGIRELSYELSVDAPEKPAWRVEFSPLRVLDYGKPLFDNEARRNVGEGVSIPSLRKGIDESLLVSLDDTITAPYLVIKVNGKRIFCRGGNWGMDDAMKRVSRERLEPYFKLNQDAHFNMVRNWTGESTEEVFFELCDEYGMLVWNDFWMSTEGYNLTPTDDEVFLCNAEDVVRRFRNHPSIAIWCPRNEGYAPKSLEEKLVQLVFDQDGTRYYQPNSRYMNLRPSGPWHYFRDPADYFRNVAHGFSTELGTPSIPTAESMRRMMAPEDLWPISDVWYYHDLHDGQQDFRTAVASNFGDPVNLDDFCRKAQMLNYESHRAMFESWNSRMWNNTSGLLLWMTHPAWPSTVWQVYSWDYETFGSYFACMKACEPIHIQMNLNDNKVVVINTTLKDIKHAKAILSIYTSEGKLVSTKSVNVEILANSKSDCFIADLPDDGLYLANLSLRDESGNAFSENSYWKCQGQIHDLQVLNKLDQVELTGRMFSEEKGCIYFRVKNTSKTIAVSVKLNLKDKITHNTILPAYFSDGYFNLLPGESKTIRVEFDHSLSSENLIILAEGYNAKGTIGN